MKRFFSLCSRMKESVCMVNGTMAGYESVHTVTGAAEYASDDVGWRIDDVGFIAVIVGCRQ